MIVKFTTWEEWNDTLSKMNAGLVVCPDCQQWVSVLLEIPEEYRNLYYRKTVIWWNQHSDIETGATKEEHFAYLESQKEKTRYCCDACMLSRANEKAIVDLEEKYDKCDSCGKWVEKGSTRPHRRHKRDPSRHFCPKCIEVDEAETEFLARTAKERQRIFVHNKRAAALGLVADLTIHEWLEILKKYDNKCAYCGNEWSDLEHVIPVIKGGGTTQGNVVPSCHACNVEKSINTDRTPCQ